MEVRREGVSAGVQILCILLHDVTALWVLLDPGVHCVTDVCCLVPLA